MKDFETDALLNSPVLRYLAWTGVALQVLAAIAVYVSQQWTGVLSISILCLLSAGFLAAQDRLPSLIGFLLVAAAGLNAAAYGWDLFDRIAWYDEFIHAFTPIPLLAGIAILGWRWGLLTARPASAVFVLQVSAIGLAIGIGWEILEAIVIDLTLLDTITDLALDVTGSAVGALLAAWMLERGDARHPARA